MKISLSVVVSALTLIGGVTSQSNSRCSTDLYERRNIRNYSGSDFAAFRSTYLKVHKLGWFGWFTYIHKTLYDALHETAEFLPWHRRYITEVELTMRYYDKSFTLPYFDSNSDCKDPASSVIFRSDFFGGNGRDGDRCITNGLAAGLQFEVPNTKCLQRDFTRDEKFNLPIERWQCPEEMSTSIDNSRNFFDISFVLEYGVHAKVHNNIGGDMINPHSPNDFIFFMHHANIDRLWLKYQNKQNNNNKYDYTSRDGDKGRRVSINDDLSLFSEPIINNFDVGYGFNCYKYDDTYPVFRRGDSNMKKRQDSTNSALTDKIKSVPQMNLASILDADTLAEFFPSLVKDSTEVTTNLLPSTISPTADSVADTLLQPMLQAPSPNSNTTTSDGFQAIRPQTISAKNGTAIRPKAASVPDDLKYPLPNRIPESYIVMMHMSKENFEIQYQRELKLANALNAAGYISPYI
ncbi:hypothetical protein BB561_005342 [Smittium simulii]|uniref:Tyrosinase copper-binding domain-containing protein n=1 Tax=Smittium simulii TaxID=133385 RepID=A0A2T9YAU9_9FUNG|nr:hypothetical protein BB561_005342 [Smittium simulii]